MAEIHVQSGLSSSIFPHLRRPLEAMEKLIDDLPSDADAKFSIWDDWQPIVDAIVTKKKRGTLKGPVIFIAHSQARESAERMSFELAKWGISVDYIAMISPSLGTIQGPVRPLGSNVMWVDEFYEVVSMIALGRIFGGGKPFYGSSFSGIKNVYRRLSGGHVGVAANPFVRKTIINKVKDLLA